ncbi:MAG TPA: ABC transporter substrate-binding protein [Microthrixaceae bacterium]|nr:ABC transporter substrate-binding protein [Microthrixaceae bacterium]
MKRPLAALLVSLSLVAAACGANGGDSADDEESSTTQASASGGGVAAFGTMDSPCGEDVDGTKVTVKADEAGRGTDKLYVGVANDRTNEARPGLLAEMYDATVAFANWCNSQGGIGGLPLEVIDLDGQLTKVEKAMTTACSDTFAMVGGGFAQDNLVFTGKDGSDFHKCKMIAFAGFAVSTDFSEANGVVQPIPNPAHKKATSPLESIKALYPTEVEKTTFVYGEGLPSIRMNKEQSKAVAQHVGYGFVDDITYALLNQDFSVTAQKVIDVGATAVSFIGEPEGYSSLLAELETKGYQGITFSAGNQYDEKLVSRGSSADGAIITMTIHPFEEADEFPGVREFLDVMDEYGPGEGKVAGLSIQSFSAGLLFARAAKDCAAKSGGQISRQCVMEATQQMTEWDGGGLHVVTDPSATGVPSTCSMLVRVKGGAFERLSPELGGEDDNGDGFYCIEDGIIEVEGDFGQGNVDPTRPY